MSGYSQPAAKRQKVREMKDVDYFQGIDKIEYNNMAAATDTGVFRYYNSSERVHARPMEDWLKCSVSLTEFRMNGTDKSRPWDNQTHTLDNHKRTVKALFDLLSKLGIKYWTAFDSDLVPCEGQGWEEGRAQWEEMVEFVNELAQRYHVRLLWLAPDLHSNTRYASGALTSPDASTFIQAASQIKRCVEMSQRMSAEHFLLWPARDGYDAIFQTDVAREIKLFAKLLKMTAEYKDRLNYRCQLLIMPYCGRKFDLSWQHRKRDVHSYMWDVTSCLYFLKSYNLERFYKVCSPPGQHMYMANVYNMLGGVTVNNDFDHFNSKKLTLMMKSIVDQGAPPPAGINLRLHRATDPRGVLTHYLKYVDALAKALRVACNIVGEQVFNKHIQQRYISYHSGLGSRLVGGEVSMEECEEYHKKNQNQPEPTSKCEHFDVVFQRYLDSCDHI
ncbi:xylose isomerase-like isoform X2 [Choristoneura fumiferana]|uniref:xylose isomerase-like isoform X2 n=1 Tax=Choristoneura fumiferana TaxID=7141 RepID=UPI003D15DFA7